MQTYLPEESLPKAGGYTAEQLHRAMQEESILYAPVVLCDEKHDLYVDLGCCTGCIARQEAAVGIAEGETRDIAILARVGKTVGFRVLELPTEGAPARLSRRLAQEEVLTHLLTGCRPGDVLPAVVTNLTPFGAFCDVGCGVVGLLGIENISVSRIPHPSERFREGQHIFAVLLGQDPVRRRITLTHKELLGTWAENAAAFQPGQTVTGIVRSVRDYGAFVELTPNLSGLAESNPSLHPGDAVSVYIKSILPEKLKIKLVAIRRLEAENLPKRPLQYRITEGHISMWQYGNHRYAKHLTVF